MSGKTKGTIFKSLAIVIDVGAPLATTFSLFPLWVEKSSEATVSGLFLVFAFLSALPFIKQLKAYFKSPSSWVVWTVIFVLLVPIRNIVDEMLMVSLVGALSNMIGAVIYKIGSKFSQEA